MIKLLRIGVLSSVLGPSWYDEIVQWWYNVRPASQTVAQHCTRTLNNTMKKYVSLNNVYVGATILV